MPRSRFKPAILLTMLAMLGAPALAQEAEPTADVSQTDATEQASNADDALYEDARGHELSTEAQQSMDELLDSRQPAPVIAPQPTPDATGGTAGESVAEPLDPVHFPGTRVAVPAARGEIDPAVLGIAPGEEMPPLRREGEFVVNRRGRLIRSTDGGYLLFVFESDTQHSPELPMVVQACRLLETMEDIVEKRGDNTIFILSGQINSYRGANYILPTMMKIAFDQGNMTN